MRCHGRGEYPGLDSVRLFSPFGYYFVTRRGRQRERAIAAFLAWLQAEAVGTPDLPA